MNQDDIIKIARAVGDSYKDERGRETFSFDLFGIQAFEDRVAGYEREACAKVCTSRGALSSRRTQQIKQGTSCDSKN